MVVELVKSLKPKRLKPKKARSNILNELRREGGEVAQLLGKTTATWTGEKPKFEALFEISGEDAIVIIGPVGSNKAVLKWIRLDGGTRPHVIRAKNAPTLIFAAGFKAKTRVNVIGSFKGNVSGPVIRKKQVNHPGTEPRNFSKVIVKSRRKKFTNRIIIAARI